MIEFQRYKAFESAKSNNEKGKQHYLALVLNPTGEKSAINLGAAYLIDKNHTGITSIRRRIGRCPATMGRRDLVIKPLKEAIGDAQTLFISPDAELNRVPFVAISSHKDDQLLGDAVNIRLLTTGRELLDLAKRSKSSKQKSLVVANPAFNLAKTNQPKQEANLIASNTSQKRSGDLTTFGWDTLPGSAKEGNVIAELTNAQLIKKDKATSLALQEQNNHPRSYISLAMLIIYLTKKKERTINKKWHCFSWCNHPEANPKDDGYLTALEVY